MVTEVINTGYHSKA